MTKLSESDIAGSVKCHNIPEKSGVYLVTDLHEKVLYVGSTNCLRRRIAYLEAHVYDSSSGGFTHGASDLLLKIQEKGQNAFVFFIICEDYKNREQILREKYMPPWNKHK